MVLKSVSFHDVKPRTVLVFWSISNRILVDAQLRYVSNWIWNWIFKITGTRKPYVGIESTTKNRIDKSKKDSESWKQIQSNVKYQIVKYGEYPR